MLSVSPVQARQLFGDIICETKIPSDCENFTLMAEIKSNIKKGRARRDPALLSY